VKLVLFDMVRYTNGGIANGSSEPAANGGAKKQNGMCQNSLFWTVFFRILPAVLCPVSVSIYICILC
jgi:hypothetical protein